MTCAPVSRSLTIPEKTNSYSSCMLSSVLSSASQEQDAGKKEEGMDTSANLLCYAVLLRQCGRMPYSRALFPTAGTRLLPR